MSIRWICCNRPLSENSFLAGIAGWNLCRRQGVLVSTIKGKNMKVLLSFLVVAFLLAGCAGKKVEPDISVPSSGPSLPAAEPHKVLSEVPWDRLDGWHFDHPAAALETFQQSCSAVAKRTQWRDACALAKQVAPVTDHEARLFFEKNFQPYQVRNDDGSEVGQMTGYYAPELEGRRQADDEFRYPLYGQPDNLLTIDLGDVYPELGNYRLRGRLEGNRVVPYFQRSEIDNGENPLVGNELFWVKDPVDLFFLHIQGSGRIRLPGGERVMVNYANQNGYPYHSIGKLLLERKEMTRDQMSMQNIRIWVQQHPQEGMSLLAENPSYIFFRELEGEVSSPLGALGIPLTALRSLAVDPRSIPLGAPVFVATTYPGTELPLQQLMVAQDTGGAIKGRVRADFFWGMGADAGSVAGKMKQDCRLWVLLPKENLL
jgi:membrane-bound lytic murein transglycosylase A